MVVERSVPRPFKFEPFCAREEECSQIIHQVWLRLLELLCKLERCAADLRRWSGSKFGNITRKVRAIDKELKFAYNGPRDSFSMEAIRKLEKDRDRLLLIEKYWQQRSRLEWLKGGD
ncbi:hypothetical protein TorRG33x02_206660 [Trema orientale]|uniref:Uncharacterized protein n=1 Tax=Trema orientale TaxID=63057 RepID=A0A2P5ED84_TREOI|nr:hypothetical protein TorRG33x02_206660 [Trema orientale]